MEPVVDWLYPQKRHPYYIVAPPYIRQSAGIRVLHLLCHALNLLGYRAYIALRPTIDENVTHPGLCTPLLTTRVIEYDFLNGLTPIVIYPETVPGNPLGASIVVRYVLNYPGLLGGDTSYPESEICVAYSETLAASVPNVRQVLFLPASDPAVFRPFPRVARSGSCYYAAKYQAIYGGQLSDITKDSVAITRGRLDSQSLEEIAALFRRSELFYCYENTALAIEALLCECPVVFIPSEFLTEIIGIKEHGWDGIAWGTDPAEIERAKASVSQARAHYLKLYDKARSDLSSFIALTQEAAKRVPYGKPVGAGRVWARGATLLADLIAYAARAVCVLGYFLDKKGVSGTIKAVVARVLNQGSRRCRHLR